MQVVRRRAVPREVGPPPGGPALVHTQIPVVFFTQAGVPGEAADVAASSQGLAAVCTQAMNQIGQPPGTCLSSCMSSLIPLTSPTSTTVSVAPTANGFPASCDQPWWLAKACKTLFFFSLAFL